mgnify:CR=1 FL=1
MKKIEDRNSIIIKANLPAGQGRKSDSLKKSSVKGFFALITTLSACAFSGCSLALKEAETRNLEEDRLVGVFVTMQHLDNGTPEFVMNSAGEIVIKENREGIPGKLILDEAGPYKVVFEGIEGYGVYSVKVRDEALGGDCYYGIGDDAFSDTYWQTGEKDIIETTIYVSQEGPDCFYFNPVYQTAQGETYMQPGNGLSFTEKTEGVSFTHTLSQDKKITEDGRESVSGSSFTIHVTFAEMPAAYRLLFLTEDNSVEQVMTGEELLKTVENGQWELRIPDETAYLILEQENERGEIKRIFCDRGEESLEFLQSLGGGILAKQQMSLCWE